MLIWLEDLPGGLGVEDGVLRAAEAQHVGDVAAARSALAAQREATLAQARDEAAALLQSARTQAAALADAAAADAQRAVAQGYEEGLRRAILEWHARQAGQTVDKATALRRMHEKLAAIVTAAVERIVHSEQRGALYQRALRSVQGLARGANALVLRVNEADHAHALAALESLSSLAALGLSVEVSVDPALPPGSCVFESEAGIVDASLHTQLEGLRTAMDRAVGKAVADGGFGAIAAQDAADEPLRDDEDEDDDAFDDYDDDVDQDDLDEFAPDALAEGSAHD